MVNCICMLLLALAVALAAEKTAISLASASQTCKEGATAAADGSCTNDGSNRPHRRLMDPIVRRWIDGLPTNESLYLDGGWVKPTPRTNPSDDGSDAGINDYDPIDVIDPSSGQAISRVNVASQSDVNLAVQSARRALTGWSIDTTLEERRAFVVRLYNLYEEHAEQMAQLISHEMGAPLEFARDDQVGSGLHVMQQFLREIDSGNFVSEYRLNEYDDTTIINEAIGVAALITPWNWPMYQILLKVVPGTMNCASRFACFEWQLIMRLLQ